MRRARRISALVLAVGGIFALAACGGDSSPEVPIVIPTETTTGSASQTDFIEQADAVCEEANTAISQFASSGQGLTEAGQIADLRQGVADELNDLGPPEEDRTTLDEFLAALEAQVEAGQKIALAQDRGEDTAQFETELDSAKSDAEAAASAYGFTQCGQQVSASSSTSTDGTVAPSDSVTPAPVAPSTGGSTDDTGGGTDDGGTGSGGGAGGIGPG